jgi:hypothetical protein
MPASFIQHDGCRILLLDFARIQDTTVLLQEIEKARLFVAAQPKRKELFTLVDLKGLRFNDDVLRAFRELTKHDEPWEKAVAVSGLSTLGKVAFRAVNLLTGGRLTPFYKREEALAWLVKQAARASG